MYGLLVLIVMIVVVVLLAIALFSLNSRRDHGDAAGEIETPEAPGSFYGEAPAPTRHPTSDFIGEEAQDLRAPDPQAEEETWREERERYREKNDPS
jgi:hypothetical protein